MSVAKAVGRRFAISLFSVAVAFAALIGLWSGALNWFDVRKSVGRTPTQVWDYLFLRCIPNGVTPQDGVPTCPPGTRVTWLSFDEGRHALLDGVLATLADTLLGFVIGMLVALLVASLFVIYKPFEFAFMPIAILARSVPLVAIAPVMLLLLGNGKVAITAVVAIVVLFPALVNLVLGMRGASAQAVDLVEVFGGGPWTALWKVRIPASLPNLFASIRISLPGAVVGAMLGEWLASFDGLGGMLAFYNSGQPNPSGVWAIVVVSIVLALVLYTVGATVEAFVLAKWGPDAGRA